MIVIKFSSDYVNVEQSFSSMNGLMWDKELFGVGQAQFSLPISSGISDVKELKKVAIYFVDQPNDELQWSGYVEDIVVSAYRVQFFCKDERSLMRNRMFYSEKNYNTSVGSIVSDMLTEANTRAGDSFFSWEVSLSDTVEKTFVKGTDYYTALDEMCEQIDAEWDVVFGKLVLKPRLGVDMSASLSNYLELRWSYRTSQNNITNYRITKIGKKIANAIIGKSQDGYSEQEDTSLFPRVERFVSFDGGDLAAQTLAYLNKHKKSQFEYGVDIVTSDLDFRSMEVGDTIKLSIEGRYDFNSFSGEIRVIGKRCERVNGYIAYTVTLASEAKRIDSAANTMQKITSDIEDLKKKI